MQKQSGGQTPGPLRFNHICKDARSRPLTLAQHKRLPKSYADAASRPTYNSNRNQYNDNRQVSNNSQKELADLRSILTDLSRQITNLATEYKSMKMSGNTAQT